MADRGSPSDSSETEFLSSRASEFCVIFQKLITCCDYKDNAITRHHQNALLVNLHQAIYTCSLSFPCNQKQALLKWLFGITVNIWSAKRE